MSGNGEIRLVDIPSFRVAFVHLDRVPASQPEEERSGSDFVGTCAEHPHPFARLGEPQTVAGIEGIGVVHGDVTDRSGESLSFDQCVLLHQGLLEVSSDVQELLEARASVEEPALQHTPPGLYAVVRYQGPYDGLREAYRHILDDWLPSSGYRYSGGAALELYYNAHNHVPPERLATDVCIPVAQA